ncbi:MAG TPA: hypothetical protein VMW75_15270 [Thermoanaerobaculia bacterium]|nr:hypothetical protein [Thermoanaerobaculia bacterium]
MPPLPERSSHGHGHLSQRTAERLIWTAFAAGLVLAAVMVARSQVGGDQLNLLARGWLLAARRQMVWFGNPLSTGGKAPGGVTSLLVGLPLLLWRDHRAATALLALCHVAAYLVLDRTLVRIVTPWERLAFVVLYWLSPWQLYFGTFLWNPNYLFLGGALHLATAWRLRRGPRFAASAIHAATLALALQIHPSFLLLLAASALLWWRGYLRPHAGGAALGALVGVLPLLPWAWQVFTHPVLLAEVHKGFPGRGVVYSLPRGILYWLRYSSLSLAGRSGLFDFTEVFGAAADRRLSPFFRALTEGVGPATVVLPLLANLWLWRRWRRRLRPHGGPPAQPPAALPGAASRGERLARLLRLPRLPRLPETATGRDWLKGYVVLTFLAAAAIYALSPTTMMYWQGLCLFHAAVLPLTLYAGLLLRTRFAARVLAGAAAYVVLELLLALGIAFGTPDYRCRGLETVVFPLLGDSPMFHELHIQDTCPWPLGDPHGWWPDVLPRPGAGQAPAGPPPVTPPDARGGAGRGPS